MGERVKFLVNEPVGDEFVTFSSKCSGFPFDLIEESELGTPPCLPAAGFPISMTQDRADERWWRIKDWALDTDLSITNGAVTFNFSGCEPVFAAVAPQSGERELMQRTINRAFEGRVSPGFPWSDTVVGFNPFANTIARSADLSAFYPSTVLQGFAGDVGVFAFDIIESALPAIDGVTMGGGTFTATIDGDNVTVHYRYSITGGWGVSVSFMDLIPVEWWEHDDGNGNPVWDSATGAVIHDPNPLG